jgi:hypothetical protein
MWRTSENTPSPTFEECRIGPGQGEIKASGVLGQRPLVHAWCQTTLAKGPRPMGGDAARQMWVTGLYGAESSFPTPKYAKGGNTRKIPACWSRAAHSA